MGRNNKLVHGRKANKKKKKPDSLLQAEKYSIQGLDGYIVNHPKHLENEYEILKVNIMKHKARAELKMKAEWIWKPYSGVICCSDIGLGLSWIGRIGVEFLFCIVL